MSSVTLVLWSKPSADSLGPPSISPTSCHPPAAGSHVHTMMVPAGMRKKP